MSRGINLLMGCILGVILVLPILFLALLVRLTSSGPAFHWSSRVGRNNSRFYMPKLRTMLPGAPDVATHLFESPEKYITPIIIEVLNSFHGQLEEYLNGKEKIIDFFVGQVMQRTQGRANPSLVVEILKKKIKNN